MKTFTNKEIVAIFKKNKIVVSTLNIGSFEEALDNNDNFEDTKEYLINEAVLDEDEANNHPDKFTEEIYEVFKFIFDNQLLGSSSMFEQHELIKAVSYPDFKVWSASCDGDSYMYFCCIPNFPLNSSY